MANKRMFTMKIVDSDAFLDMPLSSQCLYFHLNMRADDDGFIDNPKKIMRIIGASEDDLKLLIAKRFVLVFENGVIVIKHWRMHNTLSKSRYHETQYIEEKSTLLLKENGSYSLNEGLPLIEKEVANKWRTNGEQVENADLDLGLDIDIDKEKYIKRKTESAMSLLDRVKDGFKLSNSILEVVKDWIEYKRVDKKFTYKETGLKSLLKQISEAEQEYGTEAIATVIQQSMGNGYQGIVFDSLKKYPKKPQSTVSSATNNQLKALQEAREKRNAELFARMMAEEGGGNDE